MIYPSVSLTMNVTDQLPESLKQIEQASVGYAYAAYKAIYFVGQQIRDEARNLAPKDTGALIASIYVTRPPTEKQMGGIGGDVGSTLRSKQSTRGYLSASRAAARAGGKKRALDITELSSDNPNAKINLKRRGTKRSNYTRKIISGTDVKGNESSMMLPVDKSKTSFSRIGEFLPNSFYVSVGASVGYAIYVEFGTHNTKAQPFLRPAMKIFGMPEIIYWTKFFAKQAEDAINAKK